MSEFFTVGVAHNEDGSRVNGQDRNDQGVFQIDVSGHKFSMLSLGDCQVTMSYLGGGSSIFEPFSLKVWAAIVADASLVLDIGSYTGIYSHLSYAASPNAIIVAFEASKTTFGRLMTNILINKSHNRICPVHKAISNRSGHLDLALSGGIYTMASGESLEDAAQVSAWSRQRVETITADEIILNWREFYPFDLTLEMGDRKVDLVKIDVEGHEKSALSGMRRIIERDHPTMFVEILTPGDLDDILATMPDYEGFWIGEKGTISRKYAGDGWNALLVHRSRERLKQAVEAATGVAFPV